VAQQHLGLGCASAHFTKSKVNQLLPLFLLLVATCRGSPLSVAVTWSYLARTRSRHLTLAQVLHLDALVAGHFSAGAGDFYEGVRARLIDKDDAPKWKHSSAQQVSVVCVNC
jgi:enoyl-CoA hydratase/carnithine racemase